jgi:hypothetical protein
MSGEIIWTYISLSVPEQGLVKEGEKYFWFVKHGSPSVVFEESRSSNDPASPPESPEKDLYNIYEISSEDISRLEQEQRSYSETSGFPFYYNEPFKLKREKLRETLLSLKPSETIEEKTKQLNGMKVMVKPILQGIREFKRTIPLASIPGKLIKTVTSEYFRNFNVPHFAVLPSLSAS